MNKLLTTTALSLLLISLASVSFAHGGRLNAEGCHNQNSDKTYHCHRGPLVGQSFSNRAEVRNQNVSAPPNYRRDEYISFWVDEDGDCQNLRHEMLIRHSLLEVTFINSNQCLVNTGQWFDPYSGKLITRASDIDVDHVIPLAYAHANGGASWSSTKKQNFAIDEANLLLVDDGENQSKGAKGPSEYLPRHEFQCDYVQIWQLVATKYNLDLPIRDRRVLSRISIGCP